MSLAKKLIEIRYNNLQNPINEAEILQNFPSYYVLIINGDSLVFQ